MVLLVYAGDLGLGLVIGGDGRFTGEIAVRYFPSGILDSTSLRTRASH